MASRIPSLNFWKWRDDATSDHRKVYRALCSGKSSNQVEAVPLKRMLQKLTKQFPQFSASAKSPEISLPDGSVVAVLWSKQHFRFEGHGDCDRAYDLIHRIFMAESFVMYALPSGEYRDREWRSPYEDQQGAEEFRTMLRKADDGGQQIGATFAKVHEYRWFFYPFAEPHPPHAYVQRERHVCKFWIDPVRIAWDAGFGPSWLQFCRETAEADHKWLMKQWRRFAHDNVAK